MRGSPVVATQTARCVPVSSHRASQSRTGPDASSTGAIPRPPAGDADGEDDGEPAASAFVALSVVIGSAAASLALGLGFAADAVGIAGPSLDSADGEDEADDTVAEGDVSGAGLATPSTTPVHVPRTSRPSAGS